MKAAAALKATEKRLAEVSGDDAPIDARELVSFAVGKRISPFDTETELDKAGEERLEKAVARRLAHEPLQYIIGEWDFMGLTFSVSRGVLIPRQDTETLAEEAETLIKKHGYKTLLDICTGSGCIGVALNVRTGIKTTLSDISPAALEIARKNVLKNGAECTVVKSDLFAAFAGETFDLITANPPYIPKKTVDTLSKEVLNEPRLALDGGEDGLSLYRRIRAEFSKHLSPGGTLIMEIGFDQGKSVTNMFSSCGSVRLLKDLCGLDRVVIVTRR